MKYFTSLISVLLVLYSLPGYSANPHIDTAMGLYKKQEINRALNVLVNNVPDYQALDSLDKLKFAIITAKNLAMYRDIFEKSLSVQTVFLNSLVSDSSKDKSKFAPLFLTEVYILKNELELAQIQLDNFIKAQSKDNKFHAITNIYQYWLAVARKDKNRIARARSALDMSDPLTVMGVDVIQIMSTGKSTIDLSVVEKAQTMFVSGNVVKSSRFANYAIRIYSNRGKLSQASAIVSKLDQKHPSFIEEITQFKLINFYEPSMVDSLSSYYYQLGKFILGTLESDAKYHDMAIYYLSDLDLILANQTSAKRFKEEMLTLKRLPKGLASLRDIRQNGHGFMYGKTTRAYQAWEKAVNNAKNNPLLGAEAILMCIYLDANCPTIVQTARLKAENGRSQRFEGLNTNVGRYFLMKKEYIKAMRLLENALDRGKADGILMNEPILLLNLAEIYRINKRFSESLQIYFSLGQNFPILRQVQDAVQGEYLLRQRSTGSNNVF